MIYTYQCRECGHTFTLDLSVDNRHTPMERACAMCGVKAVTKLMDTPYFKVKGACAANGYSTNIGDVEKFTGKPFEPED